MAGSFVNDRALPACGLLIFVVAAQSVAAQGPAMPGREADCRGQVIRGITVRTESPTVAGANRVPLLGDIARAVHVNTRAEIVQRYMLLKDGDKCTELRRAESERILRAQPFIADARIDVIQGEAPGTVELDVRTTDEASIVLGAQPRGGMPPLRQFKLGNGNVAGTGIYAAVDWRESEPRRDEYGARVVDNQFLGQPWVLALSGRRSDRGGDWGADMFRPFLTGLQRLAWHAGGGGSGGYIGLDAPDQPTRAVRLDRSWASAGLVGRIGPPQRLGLLGLSVSHEDERAGSRTLLLLDSGVAADPHPLVLDFDRLTVTRLNTFLGYRNLRFVRVQGMDGLSATQDLPVGVQASAMVGRGMRGLGSSEADRLFASDLSFGGGNQGQAVRGQLRWEARRANGDFDDVVFTGRVAHYMKPNWRRTIVVSTEWGGAMRQRVPYQLRLGEPGSGLRGWEDAPLAGGWRGVLGAEDRHLVGRVGTFGDVGWAYFGDVGRVWRGDAPIAVTTPLRGSVGVSLLAAVPVGSARLWRVDLAMPLGEGAGKRFALVFSHGDRTRTFWREPGDVTALRAKSIPASLFDWP